MARCPDRKSRIEANLPIFTCTYNRLHIFLNKHAYFDHESRCEAKPTASQTKKSHSEDKEAGEIQTSKCLEANSVTNQSSKFVWGQKAPSGVKAKRKIEEKEDKENTQQVGGSVTISDMKKVRLFE